MRTAHLAPLVAALALIATSARAYDVEYPVQEKIFATGILEEDIVTSDVIYPGPHGAVLKYYRPEPVLSAALATSEDFLYPVADPLPLRSPPARSTAAAAMVALQDCPCTHCK